MTWLFLTFISTMRAYKQTKCYCFFLELLQCPLIIWVTIINHLKSILNRAVKVIILKQIMWSLHLKYLSNFNYQKWSGITLHFQVYAYFSHFFLNSLITTPMFLCLQTFNYSQILTNMGFYYSFFLCLEHCFSPILPHICSVIDL